MPDADIVRGVEQFLYREARLLDQRRFHEWLRLFTDDINYWMASRPNRYPRSSKAITILDPLRYVEEDITGADELALLETLDMGKPISNARGDDIFLVAECVRWYAEAIDKIYDEVAPKPKDWLALITREPIGVCAAVVPWKVAARLPRVAANSRL